MSDRHEHLDEGMIHAWLDGALTPDESQRVELMASECGECASLVAEARGLVAASSRILSSLDAVPGAVVPGASAGNDQLAALRARRQATTRRWWRDRRIVVAASLVLVAGVSRMAWQSTNGRIIESPTAMVDAAAPPAGPPVDPVVTATAPASTPAPSALDASTREAKSSAPNERRGAPERVAIMVDTVASQKVAAASTLARRAPAAASELRRIDSTAIVAGATRARADSATVTQLQAPRQENQQRQQALGGATRQAPLGFSRDSAARAAAPPASFGERLRQSPAVPAGAGASLEAVTTTCYVLRLVSVVDTVRLLNQMIPIRSDPSWFRAIASGSLRDSTLAWRSIDSVTVELRRDNGADGSAMRFTVTGTVPDVRGLTGVRALASSRLACP